MKPDFKKYPDGLVPAIIQDSVTNKVLMLGYMNEEAYNVTLDIKKATFYSRSKESLWVKGETSGNYLYVEDVLLDCDNDCLLVKVKPVGPVCHTGADKCFNETNNATSFIPELEGIIEQRKKDAPENSHTARLFKRGINKIAQKVGEEAVELVIEAIDNNIYLFTNEAADLLFHYLVLLHAKGITIKDVEDVLRERNKVMKK